MTTPEQLREQFINWAYDEDRGFVLRYDIIADYWLTKIAERDAELVEMCCVACKNIL